MKLNQEVKFCKLPSQEFYFLVYATTNWDPNRLEILAYEIKNHKWYATGAITADLAEHKASIKVITPEGRQDLVKYLFTRDGWFK